MLVFEAEMLDAEALARRLKALIKQGGGNKIVAQRAKIPLSTLNSYLSGTEMKVSAAEALAAALGVSLDELLCGASQRVHDPGRPIDQVLIPLREVYASAGPGAENNDESPSRFLSFDPFFADEWGIPPERVEAIIARGDSMEPTILDRSVVLLDRGDRDLRDRKVFAFRTPDGLRLKRFQRTIDGAVLLVSDNQALYAPERIAGGDLVALRVVGRAFWTGREI